MNLQSKPVKIAISVIDWLSERTFTVTELLVFSILTNLKVGFWITVGGMFAIAVVSSFLRGFVEAYKEIIGPLS